jgi:DNA-binding transcriptional MerR regulator
MERLRSSGMSVAELRRYTVLAQRGAVHLEELRTLLQDHRRQLQERMAELRRAERLIDEKIAFYARWIGEGERPAGHRGERNAAG